MPFPKYPKYARSSVAGVAAALLLGLLVLCVLAGPARAQCGRSEMNKVGEAFDIGRFREVINTLNACLEEGGMSKRQKVLAYRILSVSYIELDSMELATKYASDLITLDPSFNLRAEDPLRFQQLIRDLRQGLLRNLISSVSKSSEALEDAPATVVVVDEQEIQERGYQDLIELLSDLPGLDITIGNGPGYAFVYQRGYRSVSTDRTLFLIDGVEENDLSASSAYISRQIPMSNIKRVEVIYGPASTMYGPNASVGVINVVTKTSQDIIKPDNHWGMSGRASYGTYNTQDIDITVAGRYKNASLTLTGRRFLSHERDFSGFQDWDYALPSAETYQNGLQLSGSEAISSLLANHPADSGVYYTVQNGTVQPTQAAIDLARNSDQQALDSTINGHKAGFSDIADCWGFKGKLQIADLTVGYQTWFRKEGNAGWYSDRHASARQGDNWIIRNSFLYLNYQKALTDRLSLTVFTRYKAHELDERTQFILLNSYENGRLGMQDLLDGRPARWSNVYFYRLSKQLRNEVRGVYHSERLDAVFGAEVRNSFIQGNYITSGEFPASSTGFPDTTNAGNYFNQRDIGLYAQGTFKAASNLKLTLGGRLDQKKVRSDNLNMVFNPRVAAVYSPGNFILKAIYGRAYREASNLTRYATTASRRLNNPGIAPEIVNNYELSLRWKPSNKIDAELLGYYANYTGIIGLREVPYQGGTTQQFGNIGESDIMGVQLNTNYREENWDAYFNYTYTYPQTAEEEGGERERIADIASHRINLGATYRYEGLSASLGLNCVGKRETPNSIGGDLAPVPAYTLVNLALTYGNRRLPGLKVQVKANNLLDLDYDHPGVRTAAGDTYAREIPQYRRRMTLRLMYEF